VEKYGIALQAREGVARWVTKVTNIDTHSEGLNLIALSRKELLRKSAFILTYT